MEALLNATLTLRSFLYLVTRNESTFEKVKDVPDYITEAIPLFITFVIAEQLVLRLRGKKLMRVNDSVGSMSSGILMETSKIVVMVFELVAYVWIYEKFNLVQLDWNSAWTWWACLVGVDCCYYWLHRFSHEVNVMWAAHQVHHSSEDYNLSTALRQSMFQQYFAALFYLPLALFVPPSIFLVHLQFTTLYQFLIHTCAVGKLGPFDYLLNTPSNHRVHHGRNRYCIDKNYAGVFMIWDQMFGTYQAEEDEVVFGLVHPINTFDPIYIQFCHFKWIWTIFWKADGLSNKLSVLLKGPGWEPEKPRLGLIEDIPDISAPQQRYDPHLPCWVNVYVMLHFAAIILGYQEFALGHAALGQISMMLFVIFIIYCLVCLGAILDRRSYAPVLEVVRCVVCIILPGYILQPLLAARGYPDITIFVIQIIFFFSSLHWIQRAIDITKVWTKSVKQD